MGCRMSSKIFPWCTEWSFEELPQKQEVADNLAFAGRLARAYDQRLTFHPSHFVKLGCEAGPLLNRSIKELEVHSQVISARQAGGMTFGSDGRAEAES